MQSDPIGLGGGLNTYGYVDQDPIGWVDDDGLAKRRGTGNPRPQGRDFNGRKGTWHKGQFYPKIGPRYNPKSNKAQQPKFPNLKDHAYRHSNKTVEQYYREAFKHTSTGRKFKTRHDGQTKQCFVTRTGADNFTFTSTSNSGNTIFTHMNNVNTQYLRNKGVTLPGGF